MGPTFRQHLTRLVVATLMGSSALVAAAPHAVASPVREADPGDPLGALITPTYVDPLIELLAALPTRPMPYTGTTCPSGQDACIGSVVTTMQQRLAPLAASCSHHAIFSLAYLRVTENVRDAVNSGFFDDRVWLRRLDAEFAQMYFDTMDRWRAGGQVDPAWQVALGAADERRMTGLGDFLLNMNAHINNDFPLALNVVGLADTTGSHKSDHNRYNQRLDGLYSPVFAEEAARFDPTFDDIDVSTAEETAAGLIMRGWREAVWRNAEALAHARTPLERMLVRQWIRTYARAQADLITAIPIFRAGPAQEQARDTWCRTHG